MKQQKIPLNFAENLKLFLTPIYGNRSIGTWKEGGVDADRIGGMPTRIYPRYGLGRIMPDQVYPGIISRRFSFFQNPYPGKVSIGPLPMKP